MSHATVRCPDCDTAVPAGAFCAECGAHLPPRSGDGPAWLRANSFCAAPQESVFQPSLASSLLPQLSELTRRPFNLGLVLLVLSMAVLVESHLPGGLITVAALGLPLLVIIYWARAGAFGDIPRWAVLTTAVLAVGLAVGWVLLTGDLVDRTTAGSPFEAGAAGRRVLRDGLGVAEGGAILMLLPAAVVRVLWRSRRKALDGFVIGGLSALLFTATATLTRLAPQFASGAISRNQPVRWLFFEATVRGLAIPLTAACAGGLIGTALWFNRSHKPRSRVTEPLLIVALALFGAAVLGVYAAVGWADVEGSSQLRVLAWHLGMALVALIVLRLGLQLALLHEDSDHPIGDAVLCSHCRHVVPEWEFCPACGVAVGAATSRSRRERRRLTPDAEGLWPGYGVPAPRYDSEHPARRWAVPVLGAWLAALTALTAVFVGVPALTVSPQPRYNCPPDCGTPPQGKPVSSNPRFTAKDGSFSVAYPAPGTNYSVATDDTGVTATFTAGDGGTLRLTSEPAAGRTAEAVARAFIDSRIPNATKAFEIPNAMVGFEPGYGEVADVFPVSLDSSFTRTRAVVIVAIKNNLALIAAAKGPFRQFGPNSGPGRPSPTNLQIAEDMSRYVNSFRWAEDPLG